MHTKFVPSLLKQTEKDVMRLRVKPAMTKVLAFVMAMLLQNPPAVTGIVTFVVTMI